MVEGQLISVDCGVIQVDSSCTTVGDRCNDLKRRLQPLLSPLPAAVFVESFHGHGSTTDTISISLRAVIAMEMSARGIALHECTPQSWKATIGVAGNEVDKSIIKAKLEATLGASFPPKMPNPNGGRAVNFMTDASDAAGIGLWGLQNHHASLSYAAPVVISMPSFPPPETASRGQKRAVSGKAKAPATAQEGA